MKRVAKRKPCVDCEEPTTKTRCKPCGYRNRVVPIWNKSLKGIHLSPATEFKKGVRSSPKTEFRKGEHHGIPIRKGQHLNVATEFTRERTFADKNSKWKGNKVGYFSLHGWLSRNYGKPELCEECGSTENVQWASKNYKYTRVRTDWIHLCYGCHRIYDRTNGWGIASKLFNFAQNGERNV